MSRLYEYVGPDEILAAVHGPAGVAVRTRDDLGDWVRAQHEGASVVATFVLDEQHTLRVAPRRSEHVGCAGGGRVYAAGELTATTNGEVIEISNQSTGYCPEPACWSVLREALDRAGIVHPGSWTAEFLFRRCEACGQRCLVKDEWFVCDVCDGPLPKRWNF